MVLSKRLLIAAVFCGLFLVGQAWADELSDMTQGFLNAGISAGTIDTLFEGSADTLGQRALGLLNSGAITQRQYDKIYNSFMSLTAEKRQQLKNAYTKGYAGKIYDKLIQAGHEYKDDASLRDHIKDLRQQGLTREQIIERLRNEGISAQRLKEFGYDVSDPSRPEHVKDLRDSGAQHQMDIGHEKYQNLKLDSTDISK